MRCAVRADDARPIYRKNRMNRAVNRHIMDELIVATLQKGRVNRTNRPQPLLCHTRSHGNCMFLCNADIEKAAWKPL